MAESDQESDCWLDDNDEYSYLLECAARLQVMRLERLSAFEARLRAGDTLTGRELIFSSEAEEPIEMVEGPSTEDDKQ